MDGQHGRLHQAEAAQRTEQLMVAEGLATRREAGPRGRLLQQRRGSEGLQQTGLLVVAIAEDHAVRARPWPEACTESTDLLMRGFSRGGMVFMTLAAVFANAA